MYQAVVSSYGYPKYHVLGPDGEIRLANVPLKDALRVAASFQAGLIEDHPRDRCSHGKALDARCHECWLYS